MAEELAGNHGDEGIQAVNTPKADVISNGHDAYELQTLDMVQPEPQKTRSKLRLLAILIALDVSARLHYALLYFRF